MYSHEVLPYYIGDGLEFPLKIRDINERQNAASINVYVVEEESGEIYPLRIYETYILDQHWDLLYLQELDNSGRYKEHYSHIANLSRLVSTQKSKDGRKQEICRRCLILLEV